MPAWPRDILPSESTPLVFPAALRSRGQTGTHQFRATTQRGRTWQETYPAFQANSPAGQKLFSTIRRYLGQGTSFTIQHYLHLAQKGGGTGAVTVNGAGQTGSNLVTTGWGGTNPILLEGDLLSVGGITHGFEVTADVNRVGAAATLPIFPSIFAGGSPSNGAAITYTGVLLNAYLVAASTLPSAGAAFYVVDLTLGFEEAVS